MYLNPFFKSLNPLSMPGCLTRQVRASTKMSKILLSKAHKLQIQIHESLNENPTEYQLSQINASMNEYQLSISQLKQFKEIDYEKRTILKEKIKEFEYDIQDSKKRFTTIKNAIIQRNRQELLQNSYQAPVQDLDETTILTNQSNRLDMASGNIDQYIEIGRNSLNELYQQRDIMKNTQKRLLDIGNRLGLSKTVMKFIEQRSRSDKYVLGAGVVITTTLMYLIIKYLG